MYLLLLPLLPLKQKDNAILNNQIIYRMNVTKFILPFLLLSFLAIGQKKQLSLEEAVLQQNRLFRADMLTGFQWVPNSNQFTYFTDGYTKMVIANPVNTSPTTLLTITELNTVLGTKLRNFFGTTWSNTNTLFLNDGVKFYEYNTKTKEGKLVFTLEENSENQIFTTTKTAVAYTIDNNVYINTLENKKHIVTSFADKNIVSGQAIARSEFGISNGLFWSPKGNLLAFYQKDETEVANYPLLDITKIPGELVSIKYPMIGQKSEKPRVGIYNLTTEKTIYISPRGNQDDYLTNLTFTPDEKYVLIAEVKRTQDEMNLQLYDAFTGTFIKTLFTEKNNKWVEPEHPAFFPNEKSNNFVWISERDGYNNLYYYDSQGKLVNQLTKNKFVTKEIIGSSKKGDIIYFIATGENPTNKLLYQVTLNGKQTLVTKEEGTHQVLLNDNRDYIFDEYTNSKTPSKSQLIDSKGKKIVLLESKNKYDGYAIGSAEVKTIKAADGVTNVYTRLIKPSSFDATKKYPVLVYVYGGPHAQMITNTYLDGANLWMYWMAEQGYLVFTLDNRGSDNRGFDFESVIHANLGKNEMEDQIKGIDYLKTLSYVDTSRIAVHGWSYGGFMTTSLMLKYPDIFNVGVAGGPVTDWRLYEVMYGERYMNTPQENEKAFDENTVYNFVKNLKGKLLLIHGTNDDVVVEQHNLILIKKFIEAQKQVDYFPYPMHKHNVIGKDRVHLIEKVLQYIIEKNN